MKREPLIGEFCQIGLYEAKELPADYIYAVCLGKDLYKTLPPPSEIIEEGNGYTIIRQYKSFELDLRGRNYTVEILARGIPTGDSNASFEGL